MDKIRKVVSKVQVKKKSFWWFPMVDRKHGNTQNAEAEEHMQAKYNYDGNLDWH